MPLRRRMARRTGRRAVRRTTRRGAAVAPRRRAVPRGRAGPRGRRRRPLAALLAVGGTAAVAYKIGKNNAQRVEQYTGKPFDSLSEDELATAMDDLNIDLPEDDKQTGDQFEGAAYSDDNQAPHVDEPDYIDELERLADLKEKGIISEDEFQAKKKQLLGL